MPRVLCTMPFFHGIERRKIFREVSDRNDYLKRLETVLGETQTPCYAWALMPNHLDINH